MNPQVEIDVADDGHEIRVQGAVAAPAAQGAVVVRRQVHHHATAQLVGGVARQAVAGGDVAHGVDDQVDACGAALAAVGGVLPYARAEAGLGAVMSGDAWNEIYQNGR